MNKRPKGERRQGRSSRRVGTREVRQRFLIVCEGEQTEPNYFRAFQVPGLVVKIERQCCRVCSATQCYNEPGQTMGDGKDRR